VIAVVVTVTGTAVTVTTEAVWVTVLNPLTVMVVGGKWGSVGVPIQGVVVDVEIETTVTVGTSQKGMKPQKIERKLVRTFASG
jgi:hypothetical protein